MNAVGTITTPAPRSARWVAALIGGLATHSVVGGLAGAVVGGVAGNAIARDNDCSHQAYENRKQSEAYDEGYADRAEQDSAPPPAYRDDDPN